MSDAQIILAMLSSISFSRIFTAVTLKSVAVAVFSVPMCAQRKAARRVGSGLSNHAALV